ncbi:hypothetical protein [Spirosoma endbachense]|uniref:Uncharacterized protein n=1 Tax=Spirosoma endbachense TaxID=2666025 RepID=A0A6P1W680_9BACT|nr:hypothetical protein [Spirosoma endbachense]QHV99547.1 hypothetical protein GJR95_33060 [Spirosoma endbachense]
MNQDIVYKSIFFGGIYAVFFLMTYLIGRKVSPSLAIRVAVGCWVGLMAVMLIFGGTSSTLLFIPSFIASLVVFRKKEDSSLQQFFSSNQIYKATVVPDQVSELLGSPYYSCAEGTLTTQSGEVVQFNWWQGMTSSMVSTGKSHVTTFSHYLAISFGPSVVSEEFKQMARAKMDTSGLPFRQKFKRFFVLDTETPIRIEETQDGSFVIIWQTYHDAQHFAYYLNWLKTNRLTRAEVKPVEEQGVSLEKMDSILQVERNVSSPLTTESTDHPVLRTSRPQHEQALGQTPKLQTRSRY